MHIEDFFKERKQKAESAMQNLLGTLTDDGLGKEPKGCLNGQLVLPQEVETDSQVNPGKDLEQLCFVAVGKEVRGFKVMKNKLEPFPEPILTGRKYEGLLAFDINNVPYLAVGSRNGVTIKNVYHPEEKNISILGFIGVSKFRNINLLSHSNILLASHSYLGVIQVDLAELVNTNPIVIEEGDQEHIIFNGDNKSPLRMKCFNDEIFVSRGDTVYHVPLDSKSEELYKVKGMITALDVKDNRVYVGTDQGDIWLNGNIFYQYVGSNNPLINNLSVNESNGNVLFTVFRSPRSYGDLYTTDGMNLEIVSSGELGEEIIDFSFAKRNFLLEPTGVTLQTKNGSNKYHFSGDRARCFCVYGG